MVHYKFNNDGYNYDMSYNETKSMNEWTFDEYTNYLYYTYIKQVRSEYKIARLAAFLFSLVSFISAYILGNLAKILLGVLFWFTLICTTLNIIIGVITFVFSLAGVDELDDAIDKVETAYTRTSVALKQRERQDKEIRKKVKEQQEKKAVKLNEIYKTLSNEVLSEEEKVSEISKHLGSF